MGDEKAGVAERELLRDTKKNDKKSIKLITFEYI